jgi:hypothetical protein
MPAVIFFESLDLEQKDHLWTDTKEPVLKYSILFEIKQGLNYESYFNGAWKILTN